MKDGAGLALKVADGAHRAVPPAALAALKSMGIVDPSSHEALQGFFLPILKNTRGEDIGKVAASLS